MGIVITHEIKGDSMAKLSEEQKRFLSSIGLSAEDAFDATGLDRATYQIRMARLNKKVAYGVTPCKKGGHTLRAPSGNCMQCNLLNHVFQSRYVSVGWLYLAYSRDGGIVKIGMTNNVKKRGNTLRDQSYGGQTDWLILSSTKAPLAGEIENEIQRALADHRVFANYWKNDQLQTANEMFSCSASHAASKANEILGSRNLKTFVLPKEFG